MDVRDVLDEVRQEPTYTNYCRAVARLEAAGYAPSGVAQRIAVISNFTIQPIVTCLKVQAHLNATPMELYVGAYNEHMHEILEASSKLYGFAPDVLVLVLTLEAVVPAIVAEPWQDSAARRQLVKQGLEELTRLLASFRSRSRAAILVSNFVSHQMSPLGVLDWQEQMGIERAIQEVNHGLADWVHAQERIYVFDMAGLCAGFGRQRAFDQRMHLLADQPFATAFLPRVAVELVRYVYATSGPSRKCLVLDLDNTLWGGILGEDGVEQLRLGGDAVGEAYREFQRAILTLYNRGILLALCSRNDETEAMAVIRTHPGMILRPEHFAAVRINWLDKVSNLESLAAELNIGRDSLVFIDDDPFERQSVRERTPDILVVDLPRDPVLYRDTLLQLSVFDTLCVTAEDHARGRMYQERRAREQLRVEARSLDDYLTSLEMEITAVRAEGVERTRLFQLVHKTNQFNLTTRRYGEGEFEELTRSANCRVFGIRVRDRLGDSGIVGLVVLQLVGGVCEIESFLLSCRVLGRSIETGILAYVGELARAAEATRIRGRYISTAKNGIVRDLYERHGFTFTGRVSEADVWEVGLPEFELAAPKWARVRG